MEYPFAVYLADSTSVLGRFRALDSAEQCAYNAFRSGAATAIDVTYRRHRVAQLTQDDFRAIKQGDASTFLARKIEAGIEAVGGRDVPHAIRGVNKRAVYEILEEARREQQESEYVLNLLRPYLK